MRHLPLIDSATLLSLTLLSAGPCLAADPDSVRLEELRTRYQERLRELGPTPRERLAQVAVEPKVRAELRERIEDFAYIQQQGGTRLIRWKRRDAVIERYGVKAAPFLCEVLGSKRYWSARISAQALGTLAQRAPKQVRWLAMHDDAPSQLIARFNAGPDYELVGLHLDLDAALRALTGLDPLAEELELSQRASEERARREGARAQALWRAAYAQHREAWLKRERQRARERRELERKLDLVERGVDPERADEPARGRPQPADPARLER